MLKCDEPVAMPKRGRPKIPDEARAQCSVEGCTDLARYKGWCRMHYSTTGKPIKQPHIPRPPQCTVPGCDTKKVAARGLCWAHYQKDRRGVDVFKKGETQ